LPKQKQQHPAMQKLLKHGASRILAVSLKPPAIWQFNRWAMTFNATSPPAFTSPAGTIVLPQRKISNILEGRETSNSCRARKVKKAATFSSQNQQRR